MRNLRFTFSNISIYNNTIQSKTYCFSENDNSQNIVSDDTKIKPHNGFTETNLFCTKQNNIANTTFDLSKYTCNKLCKNNNISEDTSSLTSSSSIFRSCYICDYGRIPSIWRKHLLGLTLKSNRLLKPSSQSWMPASAVVREIVASRSYVLNGAYKQLSKLCK